ncbi:acyltransferase family protein [Hymenobacter nivis]|nr:acyltransferase family protein [Hymenobacter nivis]
MFRLLACFGVVAIHVHSSTAAAENTGRFLSLFCVSFFFITALTYFVANLNESADVNGIALKIWKRIGRPLLAWSVIYAGLLLAKNILTHGNRTFDLVKIFLYADSAEHLYYLPQLIVMQVIALSVFLLINNTKHLLAVGLFAGALGYLAWGSWHDCYGITDYRAIAVYVATAFGFARVLKSPGRDWRYLVLGLVLAGLAVSGLLVVYPEPARSFVLVLPIGGLGLLLIALSLPSLVVPKWLATLAATTYGVYLSHVLFLEALEFLLEKKHYTLQYNLPAKLLVTTLIFAISVVFTLVARRIPLLRALLLGEK